MAELDRDMEGVPARRELAADRKRAESVSDGGCCESEASVSSVGEGDVRFTLKGRRGIGRKRGGPSSAMLASVMARLARLCLGC